MNAMNSDIGAGVSYVVNSSIVCSIKSSQSVVLAGVGSPIELPLAFFHVLMAFAEARTIREAHQSWETDITIEEFTRIVDGFIERGLLKSERPAIDDVDLPQLLNPEIFSNVSTVDKIGVWMRRGRAIIIPDALPRDFAEEVYRELHSSGHWSTSEGGHDFFQYRNSMISKLDDMSPALARCSRVFRSVATRRFIAQLSGADCSGDARVAAAWYRPNDYALPHDDSKAKDPRSVAYIWYLTKEWCRDWGGALFWCPTGQYITPRFNMLVMFNVTHSNVHAVCPVSTAATARRLTVNGFWHRAGGRSAVIPDLPDLPVSPRAYGPTPPDDEELGPVIVL
jgi:Rps23 Pro-64 3,4-dihydroxylase Tpa1-like proline 4-hydroxylase